MYQKFKTYSEEYKEKINNKFEKNLIKSIHFLKNKAKKLEDIYQNSKYIFAENIKIQDGDLKLLDQKAKEILNDFLSEYEKNITNDKNTLEKIVKELILKYKTNFKGVGQPLRIALTGSKYGPGIYDIILSLDTSDVIKRLKIIK